MLSSLVLVLLQSHGAAPSADLDSDHDGLSDFQEVHKYLTDPRKADTDGDGIPDGDWDERREFAYTVRVVMQVLPPCDPATMNDDYQDVRILETRADEIEFEALLYPFNTNAETIAGAKDERLDAELRTYTEPGITSNWDAELRKSLLAELADQGIDATKLPPAELAPKAAKWLMQRATFEDSFTTFDVVFEGGRPSVHPALRETVERQCKSLGRTLEEEWQRELFGRGMFANKVHGSCTSSAIYLQTGLRALGIPTRTILCTPALDANDEREVSWIDTRIQHVGIRRVLEQAATAQKNSWTSHTFNEVWLGGRWRRLNYDHLGQNILEPGGLGLMVHVNTFRDHAEAGLVSWGLRSASEPKDDPFGGANPYSCISLSDRFGAHAKVANEPLSGLREALIGKVYWYDDPKKDPKLTTQLGSPDGAGFFFAHIDTNADGSDCMEFFHGADRHFVLRAAGHADVPAEILQKYWVDSNRGINDFILRIEPAAFARMEAGVEYELVWPAQDQALRWKIAKGVTLRRSKS